MSACVFVGPSLAVGDARAVLDATFLPPAKQGDVHRVISLLRPRVVGIIDGYFQWVPSVWHKEILWAMHQGVHVFGAASMGALRAAELAPFGMHGVGRIYEAYRDAVLDCCPDEPFEDDDEVAVEHGPGELGYVAVSEAMVNIRCTLATAESNGVIGSGLRRHLVDIAKGLFFPERTYDAVFGSARAAGLPECELAALREWLPNGRVNQKRADALALLAAIRDFMASDPGPPRPRFHFEHTTLWERSLADHSLESIHSPDEARVLEELRLDARRWDALRRDVLQSLAVLPQADAPVIDPGLEQRLADSHGEPQRVADVIEEVARQHALRRTGDDISPALIDRQVLARVRTTEDFARLLARAEDKQRRLDARTDLPDVEEFSELQLLQLRDWYFVKALGTDMPDDIEQCVRAWGYRDMMHFHRAIFAEHVYRRMDAGESVHTASAGTGG